MKFFAEIGTIAPNATTPPTDFYIVMHPLAHLLWFLTTKKGQKLPYLV